jgi:hypothetical protein
MDSSEGAYRRRCPQCGEKVSEYSLQQCSICRSLFCHRCAVSGYGRDFCSSMCREYFFHGDVDDESEL